MNELKWVNVKRMGRSAMFVLRNYQSLRDNIRDFMAKIALTIVETGFYIQSDAKNIRFLQPLLIRHATRTFSG